ncbi:MAG: peptidase, partial [Candidatus Aenigmarchaeota archaeon]|nr:peptidase [Candidatus Aenigmarchaeota archaeon]
MVFADALGFLLLLGATVVVGYVGGALYTRTRIPDAVWLLLFGLIVGPGLGLVDRAAFLALAPLLSTVALLIIL